MEASFTGTDRFVIEKQLGAGSMGAVYLALDKKLNSKVALKLLLSVDATSIYRFKNEFRALADLTHKNLVTLHELFSEGDQWFFTMEHVPGKDLLSYVHGRKRLAYDSSPRPISEPAPKDASSSGETRVAGLEMLFPTPLEDAARLRGALVQIVEGLTAVHSAGKLHRDLKPENVIVTPDGRVVLLDFGIAFEQKRDAHETLHTVIGTPAYMSPEQCRGEGVTEATDWYALGVILYECLTGDVPFDGTPMQVIQRKQELEPTPPGRLVSGVPADLEALCMRLLDRNPEGRPRASEILRLLREADAGCVDRSLSLAPQKPDLSFIGRAAQVRELEAALSQTEAGAPVVALVHGVAGIGKTTLIDHFLHEVAASQTAIVLKGRCYERESVPFKAFDNVIDSLSRYLRRLPAVEVATVIPRDVDALAELFPVLRRVEVLRRNRRQRIAPKEPQLQRQRAFRALKEMLCRVADLEPLIVFVDDVQWSDVDSARLLGELITGSDRPAMLLVCSYRSDDTEHSPGLQALLSQIRGVASQVTCHEIAVGTLSNEDSVMLARQLLGEAATEEGARRAGYECGGNPQLLTQLVRHVEQRRASGLASMATARGLVSFDHVITRRLDSLSTDGRTLLELLSVAGRPVPEPVLGLVASFNIDLQSALTELKTAKLVRGVSTHDMRAVEVYHDTISQAVRRGLEPHVHASWHRRLAAALEASGGMDLEALTTHLLGAGEHERASLYATRAAEHAERALAFDQAARLYGTAAEHTPLTERKIELLRRHGDALVAAGRGAAAAKAYFAAAVLAPAEAGIELCALGAVQLLFHGELREGMQQLEAPLSKLGISIPESFSKAAERLVAGWQEIRAQGFAFQERTESDVDRARLRRLDVLWGVTRGLMLHEHDRPLPLLIDFIREALALGEPLRVARALSAFHAYIDLPLCRAMAAQPSGALDVAEALSRKLDPAVEARAAIAFARGLSVYHHGDLVSGLAELARAEELYRNHCRGGAYEMRTCRTATAHLYGQILREPITAQLRDWLREAEEHGDRVSTSRLRFSLATAQLAPDQGADALSQLDAAVAALTEPLQGTSATGETMARGMIEIYRGNADGCLAVYYLLEELFDAALSAVPLWRGMGLLLRARLALVARAGSTTRRGMLAQAETSVAEAATLGMPCLQDDVRLANAAIAAARGNDQAALAELEAVLAASDRRSAPSLSTLFALRAKGQIVRGPEGEATVSRAEGLLRQRQIENPRRYARLFVPGLEEVLAQQR